MKPRIPLDRRIILLFALFIGFYFIPTASFSSGFIEKIGLEHGLSCDYIQDITQDKEGFLWFATEWGLNRFDGSHFKVYKAHPVETNTISSNGLNKILADTLHNIIWIATQRTGLNAFDCTTQTFIHYPVSAEQPNGTGANGITDLCMAEDGNLWIGTYNNGLKKLDIRTNTILHYDESKLPTLKHHNIWSVASDGKGMLYIGHVSEGLSIVSLKDRKVKHFTHDPDDPNSLPANTVYQIYIDSKENVWLGTGKGLALYRPAEDCFTVFRHEPGNPYSLSNNEVYRIREIDRKDLWIGTLKGGISILDIRQCMLFPPERVRFRNIAASDLPGGLSHPSVTSLFQDSFGNIWIGTHGGGANFISCQKPFFNTLTYSPIKDDTDGLSSKTAWAVCTDALNQLWVGTDAGIDRYKNGKKIKNYSRKNKNLPDDNLLSALCDSKGNIWFGTMSQGVVRYNPRNDCFEPVKLTAHKSLEQYIYCLYEDKDRNLWIGGNYGIIKYNPATKETQELDGSRIGIWNNLVKSISQDRDGNIWIATQISGISIIRPDFTPVRLLNLSKGFFSNGINHLFRDSENRMWVGSGEGVAWFDPESHYQKFRLLNQKDGIEDDYIRAVAEGLPGEIWITTNSGISHYSLRKKRFDNYTHFDNIPQGFFMNASVAKDREGTLYFGSQDGVCSFNVTNHPEHQKCPAPRITAFTLYNAENQHEENTLSIPVAPAIRLEHFQNTFTIEFNVMDHALNGQVEYQYKLEGMDDSWHSTNGQGHVTFRNVPAGTYTFIVSSRIRNQEWSGQTASLQIRIMPPFWLSWWAKTIYVILALCIVLLIARFYKQKLHLENLLYVEQENHRKEQELNDEKFRFYTNVAHELRTPLTLIIGPLGDLAEEHAHQPEQNKKISLIYRSATRLSNLINQMLEFRKSETNNRILSVRYGNLSALVREIVLKYKELNQNPKITIELLIENERTELYFDPEVFTIIADNLISNALKYTQEGKITIRLRDITLENTPYTELAVCDTGIGIPQDQLEKIFERYYQVKGEYQATGSGIGLALVKNMVQLHQGTIQVESQPGEGTSFYVRIPNGYTYPEALHAENEKPVTGKKDPSNPRLLVVEDNKEILEYISSLFKDTFEVWTAENGQAGTEIAFEQVPDLIICDIMMPVMDGIGLCKIVKEDVRTCHIPIILLTAKDSLQDKSEGYSVGADSYLTKPFTAQLLRSRVHNLLESRKKLAAVFATSIQEQHSVEDVFCQQDHEFIEKVTSVIKENIESEQLSTAFLADQLFMSESTFYRKVKALTGMAGSELIRKIRLQTAEQMMRSSQMPISEIALRAGFNSMAYFRQSFKAEYGILPSEYKKRKPD